MLTLRHSPSSPFVRKIRIGASVLGVAYMLPFAYLIYSMRYGAAAEPNPWQATGLEWSVASPPPKHNFDPIPVVTGPPYDYPVEYEGDHG